MLLKTLFSVLILLISFECFAMAKQEIPKDATICPKKYSPPLVHCNLRYQTPLPVCQYLKNGKTRQAYDPGCQYMCDKDVKAYKSGKC